MIFQIQLEEQEIILKYQFRLKKNSRIMQFLKIVKKIRQFGN